MEHFLNYEMTNEECTRLMCEQAVKKANKLYDYLLISTTVQFYFKDHDWAKQLYIKAEALARNTTDYLSLAEDVFQLGDRVWAHQLTLNAAQNAMDVDEYVAVAQFLFCYLDEQDKAKELYKNALSVTNEVCQYTEIADSIYYTFNDKIWAKEILQHAENKISTASTMREYGNLIQRIHQYFSDKEWIQRLSLKMVENAKTLDDYFYITSIIIKRILKDETWIKEICIMAAIKATKTSDVIELSNLLNGKESDDWGGYQSQSRRNPLRRGLI